MAGENGATRLPAVPAYSNHPPRQPQSPSVVQQPSPVTQASPPTVEASPQHSSAPFGANSNAPVGARPKEQPQPRMRASVACEKCRKSKTKCENEGIHSVCKSCANARQPQNCTYATAQPTGSGAPGRRESTADGEGPPKKRRKNLAPSSSTTADPVDLTRTYHDILASPLLSIQVWQELFAIYEKHLAFEFPFFHKRTFMSIIQQYRTATLSSGLEKPAPTAQTYYPPLLLAFLTQTARFHTKLIGQKNNDPIATAEFYAQATIEALGQDYQGEITMEKVQTSLLLGYHEWTALEGDKGWLRIGNAIRAAQLLKLHIILDRDDLGPAYRGEGVMGASDKAQFISHETRRRVFWSCCLMDRYLSLGLSRPFMIAREDILHQLICSDEAFGFGRKVRTRLLGEDNDAYELRRIHSLASVDFKWEVGEFENEFVWYMPAVILFNDITKWCNQTGRRQEGKVPPWNDNNRFKRFDDRLQKLKRELPQNLQLTAENTEDRAYHKPEKYVLIHAMYTLCVIFLYREYLPFAPWGAKGPEGPLEEPLITEKHPSRPNYWIDQARAFCKTCRDFADLLEAMQAAEPESLIASPIVGFAAFGVCISIIYCQIFPAMDPDSALNSARLRHTVVRYLVTVLERFKLPYMWLHQAARWRAYYQGERNRYKCAGGTVGDSPASSSSDGSRGATVQAYVGLFEMHHKQFGTTDKDQGQGPDLKELLAALGISDDDAEEGSRAAVKPEIAELITIGSPMVTGGFTCVNPPAKLEAADSTHERMLASSWRHTQTNSSNHVPYSENPSFSPSQASIANSATSNQSENSYAFTYANQGSHGKARDPKHSHPSSVQNSVVTQRSSTPSNTHDDAVIRQEMEKAGRKDFAQVFPRDMGGFSYGPLWIDGASEWSVYEGELYPDGKGPQWPT
ncbi:hypothetical protein ACN47E_002760 [Coniothyrium glycines]